MNPTLKITGNLIIPSGAATGYVLTSHDQLGTAQWQPLYGNIGAFTQQFTQSNISNNTLLAAHNLGVILVQVSIYDENDELVFPLQTTLIDTNHVAVDLTGFTPLPGTWSISVLAAGGSTGGSGSGSQGPAGATGPQGNQGNSITGPQGPQGPQGPGTQGPQGNQGYQGAAGSGGTGSGSQGPQGSQGNQGSSGTGAQGSQGSSGTASPGGSQGQIQYNNGSSLAGLVGSGTDTYGGMSLTQSIFTPNPTLNIQGPPYNEAGTLFQVFPEYQNGSSIPTFSIDGSGGTHITGNPNDRYVNCLSVNVGQTSGCGILVSSSASKGIEVDNVNGFNGMALTVSSNGFLGGYPTILATNTNTSEVLICNARGNGVLARFQVNGTDSVVIDASGKLVISTLQVTTSPTSGYVLTSDSNGNATWSAPVTSSGPQGNQGVIGSQGNQGNQGNSGGIGNQGNVGSSGPQGNQGYQGTTGSAGSSGPQGNQGLSGPQGANGTGTQGAQGYQGVTGPQGTQGVQGYQGNTGIGTPAGSTKQVQFNNGGSPAIFGGSANFLWNTATNQLGVGSQMASGDPHATLQVAGSFAINRTVPSSYPYQMTTTDTYVAVDTSSANTVSLPFSLGNMGRIVIVKDETGNAGTNNVTVTAQSIMSSMEEGEVRAMSSTIDHIDGSLSHLTISTNYGVLRLIADGTNTWYTI